MADELTARVYFRRAEQILDRVEQSLLGGPARTNLLLEAATNALLAVGMGLGVHLPLLPGLDDYCFCNPKPGEPAKHDADCSHHKPTNGEGSADATAEPSA